MNELLNRLNIPVLRYQIFLQLKFLLVFLH